MLLTIRPFLPPCMSRTNLETGASGARFEAGADAAPVGVDAADDVDVDDPVEGHHQVGQLVVGGAQVDGAFSGFVKQRGDQASAWP